MDGDAAKEALAWWLGLLQFAPPEATSSTWDEVAASFAAGRAAQGLVYGENAAWIATDETRSRVVGNVGVALPPLAEGVMEDAEADTGYIGYYDGGAFGILILSNMTSQRTASQIFPFVMLPQFFLAGVFTPIHALPPVLAVAPHRVSEATTSAEVSGLPWWNFTSLRSRIVYRLPPSATSWPSARSGTGWNFASSA